MKSTNANKLINKMQFSLQENGINIASLLEDFGTLRVYAVEEKEPSMAKLTRLVMEHLKAYDTFLIPMPQDEIEDENGEAIIDQVEDENAACIESLDSLLAMMLENTNKFNIRDLKEYINALKNFDN